LIGLASSLITIYLFFGGEPIIQSSPINGAKPIPLISLTGIDSKDPITKVVIPKEGYNSNYQANLDLKIKTYTQEHLEVNIELINFSANNELETYWVDEMKFDWQDRISVSIEENKCEYCDYPAVPPLDEKQLSIPISISNLWIDAYYTSYNSHFIIGNITLKVSLIDLQDLDKNQSYNYEIPVIWDFNQE